MAETKTLSRVEAFALRAARERAAAADTEFRSLIEEVGSAHGIDSKKDGNDWTFSPDFTVLTYTPRPKAPEAKPSAEPPAEPPAETK